MRQDNKKRPTMRPRKLIINFTITAIAILIPVSIAELILRPIHPIPSKKTFRKKDFYHDKALTGKRFKSGTNSKMSNIEFDEKIYISQSNTRVESPDKIEQTIHDLALNKQGQRKHTIFSIGDSQTFGHGLAAEKSWPSQLNQIIGTDQYHVANFGAPGTDINQFSNLTIYLSHKYPENNLFVIGISDNDLCQEPIFPLESGHQGRQTDIRTNFTGTEPSETAATHSFHSILNSFSIGKSLISATRRIQGVAIKLTPSDKPFNTFASSILKEIEARSQNCANTSLSWFRALNSLLAKKNKTVIFTLIPSGEILINEANNMLTIEQAKKLRASAIISAQAPQEDLLVLDAYPIVRKLLESKKLEPSSIMLPIDGHSNYASNKKIAEGIRDHLKSNNLIAPYKPTTQIQEQEPHDKPQI